MSSAFRPPSPTPHSTPADPSLVAATIARLRAEYDANQSPTARAILLHEIGVLEEALGDEASAARDQLGAVNTEPEFREPLERLIAIIERRQSYKNLGKLLDRLVRVAEAPDERVRGLLLRAAYLADHENDLTGAREALEQALADRPDDASLWLALEVLAGKMGDHSLRAHALSSRCRLSQDPTWRALLLIDKADTESAAGDTEQALASLNQAIEANGAATFLALMALEELGHREVRDDFVARALETQAALILRAIDDRQAGDALGVPHYRWTAAYAADTFMRAADAQRRRGDLAAATSLLDQALARLPDEPALLQARLSIAESSGDTTTAARLAQAEIDRGAKGPSAAALFLRVAEAAAAKGDGHGALVAVNHALAEDAGSIPARALQLDLLSGGHDPPALASALEAAAEHLPSDEAKARAYLMSADTWARMGRDAQGAKAALSQASMFGAAPGVVLRVARLLSAVTADNSWFEEATRRLLATGAAEGEEAGLWFELARARLLRGDRKAAAQALETLASGASGSWLGHALSAYALPLAAAAPDPGEPSPHSHEASSVPASTALKELARIHNDATTERALRVAAALRSLQEGQTEQAHSELEELHTSEASDAVVATALAGMMRARGEFGRAAAVLAACAFASVDSALSSALHLEAGILYWQSGQRSTSVDCFSAAAAISADAGGVLLRWALCAADPNTLAARRRALEASSDTTDPGLLPLERFALEVSRDGSPELAAEALGRLGRAVCSPDFRAAGQLSRALWSDPRISDLDERLLALDALSASSTEAAALVRAVAYQLRLAEAAVREPDSSELEMSAMAWAEADASPAAALEWLSHSLVTKNVKREVLARLALAQRLDEAARAPIESSAAIAGLFGGEQCMTSLEGDSAYARLTNLELAAPGSDPGRRAGALLGASELLGDDSTALVRALSGWNQLAQMDVPAALLSFRAVVAAHPDEIIGWEGLRAAAELGGDRRTFAEACAALGDAVSDSLRGAELWEQAALVLIELGDEPQGEFALSRAVERDINRFVSFDKLFRIVRSKRDGKRLLGLITKRLEVAEEPEEIAKLFWERARVLREAGDRTGALSALENVTLLEPDHVGALALSGEIYIKLGRFAEAAENLGRLSAKRDAPARQRLMSGVAAVDLYENKLGDINSALQILIALYRSGLSTLPVRERLARAAAKAGAWTEATAALEQLMHERDSAEGRIEAARLALAIYRDRLLDPAAAAAAVTKLLAEAPDDGEALDLLLSGALPNPITQPLLEQGHDVTVQRLALDPIDPERVDRLARFAAALGNAPLRQAALGALVALGEGTHEIDRELSMLDRRVAHIPQIAIDERTLPELCDPEDAGAIAELMRELANTFAEALGPGTSALGVSKKDRIDPRAGLQLRNEVAAWAGALGVGDFELYVGGRDPHGVFGIATEVPAIVLGPAVTAPLSAAHRQAVARELFALRRGTSILRHRDLADISALVIAACRLAGLSPPSPEYAMLGEFQRLLGKEMPRKVRKSLPELAARVVRETHTPADWARAATSSLDRMATIAAGDVSWVLGGGSSETRGERAASLEAEKRARRLLGFVLSPAYLALRQKLGMGVR